MPPPQAGLLPALRRYLHLSQAQLVGLLGTTRAHVAVAETSPRPLPAALLAAPADALPPPAPAPPPGLARTWAPRANAGRRAGVRGFLVSCCWVKPRPSQKPETSNQKPETRYGPA